MKKNLAMKIADICQFLPTDRHDRSIDQRVHQSAYELVLMAANVLTGDAYAADKLHRLYGWLSDHQECISDFVSRDKEHQTEPETVTPMALVEVISE